MTERQREHDAAVDSDEQPLLSHLIELRSRILWGLLIVVLLFIPLYTISEDLYGFVAAPLLAHLPENTSMIATEVASTFLTPLKLAIYAAIFFAMPVVLYQIWAFVAPGLYLHEKKFALPLLVSSIVLFYAGTAFAYYAVFPLVFEFLISVAPEFITPATDISAYLNFVTKMFFAFGLAFEVPIATLLITWTGLSTPDALARKRPYIILGCFVVGMLLTPPDVISQILLAVPTWLLFELGVFLARLSQRHTNEPHPSSETGGSSD